MKVLLVVISFVLVSCNGQKKAIMEDDTTMINSKSVNGLELLLQETNSSFEVEETLIIKDAKRLKSFYSKLNRTRKPGLPVPVIDFAKEMIIIQCAGAQNYNGFPVLSVLKETDSQVILRSKIEKENNNTSITVVNNPFCIYKLRLTQKEVIFEKGEK